MSCFLLMGIIDLFSIYHASLSFCGPLGAQLKKFCFKGEGVFVSMPASHDCLRRMIQLNVLIIVSG